MIPKVLFLALFCAAHVQGRPASSPQGNRNRVVNTWNDVGNTDVTNENFSPNESGNGNADVNAGHSVLIIGSPPIVNKRVETHQPAANDNAMKGRPSRLPNENSKQDDNVMEGRPSKLPNENSSQNNPTGNTRIDMGNTGNVNGNSRPVEGGNGNADGNGSHQLVIDVGPPKVNNKVEMQQPTANDNVMEGRPSKLPNENSSQNNPTGNNRIDMGNTGNVKGNSRPVEGGNGNADGNGSHQLVIGVGPPKVNNKVEVQQPTANDNVMEGRPSKLPNENSSQNNPTGNTRNDMGNTGNVNGNSRPNEGGNGNADGNVSHQLVIGLGPLKINSKVEMHQPTANDNVVEGRPSRLPNENSSQNNPTGNTRIDMGNTGNVNGNSRPNEGGNGNADGNVSHQLVIGIRPPKVNKKVEMHQPTANDNKIESRPPRLPQSGGDNPTVNTRIDIGNTGNVNENSRPVEGGNGNANGDGSHQLVIGIRPPKVNKKVEMHQPTTNDNVIEGRPANSANENPNLSVNALNDVANTNHVKETFSPNDSGHGNADINAGHDVIIIHGPPQVNNNGERQSGAASGNANGRPVDHREPPMTEQRRQKPPIQAFADKFGQVLGDAVKDNVHNTGKEVQSVFQVGQSIGHATGTILEAKAKLLETVPHVAGAFFGALG